MAAEITNNEGAEKKGKKRNIFIEILAILFLLAGVIWISSLFFDLGNQIKTNNAQVDAGITSVTSRAAGYIKEIRFNEYATVHAGDTLVLLDDAELLIKVSQAQADVDIAKANLISIEQAVVTSKSSLEATQARLKANVANLERAEKNYTRFENMFNDSAVTRNQFDQVTAQLKTDQAYVEAGQKDVQSGRLTIEQNRKNIEPAKATIKRKEADLASARLQLTYTSILAPADGVLGEKTIQIGELVNANQVVVDIVQQNKKWVSANFKETQVGAIKVGQKVTMVIDALGNQVYQGIVKDISPATGARFSMVAPDNSTGNFVKITQRIPVKIDFVASPEKLGEVKPGMNVSVEIKK
jgi:membrane fusion protein, multidrug efflux system